MSDLPKREQAFKWLVIIITYSLVIYVTGIPKGDDSEDLSRRKFLAASGAAGAAALAGCSNGEDSNTPEPTPTDTDTPEPGTETGTTSEDPGTTEEETTTEEPEPEGPVYVKFNAEVDTGLRRQIPSEHREELQAKGFNLNNEYTDSPVLDFDPEEHDVNFVEVGLDLVGLRQLHYNEFENLQTFNNSEFSPEMEIHKAAALGHDEQIPEKYRHDVQRAKTEGIPYPTESEDYEVEAAMNASTVEEHVKSTSILYTQIEALIDSGRNSVEDLKQAAVLEEIMDAGSDLNGHFWMTKVNQGAHGFNLFYDEEQDKIFGKDTVRNGVVDGAGEPIEDIGYADQGTVPWNYDGSGDSRAALDMMRKMVSCWEDDDWEAGGEWRADRYSSVLTNELLADTMDMIRNYNSNDAEFEEIYERSLQMLHMERIDGNYVGGFNQDGEIVYRQADEATVNAVWEDETGEYDDFTNLPA